MSYSHCDIIPTVGVSESGSLKNVLTNHQRRVKVLLDDLSLPFKMSCLQIILDFLEDDTSETLELPSKTAAEIKFIKYVKDMAFRDYMKPVVDAEPDLAPLVNRIRDTLKTPKWIRVKLGKLEKGRHHLRDVFILKDIQLRKRLEDKRMNKNIQQSRYKIDRREQKSLSPREMFMKALEVPTNTKNAKMEESDSIPAAKDSKEVGESSIKAVQQKNSMKWLRAGGSDQDSPSTSTSETVHHTVQPRHSKLIKALCVPVESDMAMRMMRRMGWKGGALGKHGDGITEPIMPALDIVTGAGLGHTPKRGDTRNRHYGRDRPDIRDRPNTLDRPDTLDRPYSRDIHDFHRTFLTNILLLLNESSGSTRDVQFERPLFPKEVKFAMTTIRMLNLRTRVKLNRLSEQDLVTQILAAMVNMHAFTQLECIFRDNMRLLTLSKTQILSEEANEDATLKNPEGSKESTTSDEEIFSIAVTDSSVPNFIENLGDNFSPGASTKLVRGCIFRLTVMQKIEEFLKSNEPKCRLLFNEEIKKRHIRCITIFVANFNKRCDRPGLTTRYENAAFKKLLRFANCKLNVTFASCSRSFVLTKIFTTVYKHNHNVAAGSQDSENLGIKFAEPEKAKSEDLLSDDGRDYYICEGQDMQGKSTCVRCIPETLAAISDSHMQTNTTTDINNKILDTPEVDKLECSGGINQENITEITEKRTSQ